MAETDYTPPVAALLSYGDCRQLEGESWPDYVTDVGLTDEDVPQLIQMALDPTFDQLNVDETVAVWAPVHAVRSLGQLRAEAAIVPLMKLFGRTDDEWLTEDLPLAYRMIGPDAISPLVAFLRDANQDTWARITAVDALMELAKTYPDHRAECLATILQQLEAFAENGADLNATLIDALVYFKVTEAAPLIEKVFQADLVDDLLVGTWPYVQVRLGLKQESDFDPEDLKPRIFEDMVAMVKALEQQMARQEPKGFGKASTSKPAGKQKKKKKG
jgi:hypothetical protein